MVWVVACAGDSADPDAGTERRSQLVIVRHAALLAITQNLERFSAVGFPHFFSLRKIGFGFGRGGVLNGWQRWAGRPRFHVLELREMKTRLDGLIRKKSRFATYSPFIL